MKNFSLFPIVVLSLLALNIRPITCDGFYQESVSTLNVNGNVMLDSRPCRITAISEPDDDGYITITGIDLFTSEIHTGNFLPDDVVAVVDVPNVERDIYTLLYINDDGKVQAIWESTGEDTTFDLLNGDLADEIREAEANGSTNTALTVLSAAGEKGIIQVS